MTTYKALQFTHITPAGAPEVQEYVTLDHVTADQIRRGEDEGVVCLCIQPGIAGLIVNRLNAPLGYREMLELTHRYCEAAKTGDTAALDRIAITLRGLEKEFPEARALLDRNYPLGQKQEVSNV